MAPTASRRFWSLKYRGYCWRRYAGTLARMMPHYRAMRTGRFLSTVTLLGICGTGAWFGAQWFEKERVIAEQKRVIAELGKKLDRIWAESLVADIRILSVTVDAQAGHKVTDVDFVQYEPGTERPSFRRRMRLMGDEVYIDALVVKFDRALVEAGDGLRGRSLLLLRRAFGNRQQPDQGVPLHARDIRLVPEVARVDRDPGDFERRLWLQFWHYANDPGAAAAAGVRVAQGEAPHVKAVPGQVYKLTLSASGGLNIVPRLPSAVLEDRASAGQDAARSETGRDKKDGSAR